MKRKILVAIAIILIFVLVGIAIFKNNSKPFTSTLPDTFSDNITYEEIKNDLANYIRHKHLLLQYGSSRYTNFLTELSTTSTYDEELSGVTLRYYRAYASYYLSHINVGEIDLSVRISGK